MNRLGTAMVCEGLVALFSIGVGAWLHFETLERRALLPDRSGLSGISERLEAELRSVEDSLVGLFSAEDRWIELGMLYLANGYGDMARESFALVSSRTRESNPKLEYFLGRIAQEEGRMEDSVSRLEVLDYAPALRLLAETKRKLGQQGEAKAIYEALLKRDRGDVSALVGWINLRAAEGEKGLALEEALQARLRHPDSIALSRLTIRLLDRMGRSEEAEEIRAAIGNKHDAPEADPWWDDLRHYCFDTQRLSFDFERWFKANRLKEAFDRIDRIEEIDPESGLGPYLRGFANYELSQMATAAVHLEAAYHLGFDSRSVLPLLVASYVKTGRFEEAEALAKGGLKEDPRWLVLMLFLGEAQFEQKKLAEAIGSFRSCLRIDEGSLKAMRYLARIHGEQNNIAASLKYLEEIRKRSREDVISRAMLGQMYSDRGEGGKAIGPLREAYESDPSNQRVNALLSGVCLDLGDALREEGDLEGALAYYEEAIQSYPNNEDAYFRASRSHATLGDLVSAASIVESLIVENGESGYTYLLLGDIYGAKGDFEKALEAWTHSMSLAKRNGEERLYAGAGARIESLRSEERQR
ncbi:MAG: tetratricopeptide repeat protein [Verrucomicrobiota bacterium]